MNKKILIYTFSTLTLATFCFCLFQIIAKQKNDRREILSIMNSFGARYIETYKIEDHVINDDLILYDAANTKKKISSINTSETKLFYVFSKNDCNSCIISDIESIKSHFFTQNIYLATDYNNERALKAIGISDKNNIKIYNLDKNGISKLIKPYNTPYFFTLDTSFVMKNVFAPVSGYGSLTANYLTQINKKYYIKEILDN